MFFARAANKTLFSTGFESYQWSWVDFIDRLMHVSYATKKIWSHQNNHGYLGIGMMCFIIR